LEAKTYDFVFLIAYWKLNHLSLKPMPATSKLVQYLKSIFMVVANAEANKSAALMGNNIKQN
jgi:hypothetical protein